MSAAPTSQQQLVDDPGLSQTVDRTINPQPVDDPGLTKAIEQTTGTTSVLSPWNNFWREFGMVGRDLTRAVVSGLENGYDQMTGTGLRFSSRTPDQLRGSIEEANDQLQDLHDQLRVLNQGAPGPQRGTLTLQSQIATINSDIEGMQHQLALKTGAVKPSAFDTIGSNIKLVRQLMDQQSDEARGLKDPSPLTSQLPPIELNPLAPIARELGQVPIIGPILGQAPPPRPAELNDPLSQAAGSFGQIAGSIPFLATGDVPLEFATIALQRSQAMRDEARLGGADDVGQDKAGTMGLIAGAIEAPLYRVVLGRFMGGQRPATVGELGLKLLKNVAAGAGMGIEQKAASNMIAVASGIDPNRKLTDGMLDSILQQSAIMGLTGGVIDTPSYLLANRTLDPYRLPGQERTTPPETGVRLPGGQTATQPNIPTTRAPTTAPGAPTAPVTAEQLAQQLARAATPEAPTQEEIAARANAIFEQRQAQRTPGDAQSDWAQAERELIDERQQTQLAGEPVARRVETPTEEQPITPQRDLRATLTDLQQRLGQRFGFRVMTPDQLPNRYKLELAKQGINPAQYSAFYAKGFDTFFVNPDGFQTQGQLYDAIIQKYVANTLANRASIHPISSYSQVSDSPAIAQMLADHPDSDKTTPGIYDRTSGNVYLNMPRILANPDPVGYALKTAVHEIAGHQGIRTFFGTDTNAYNAFLDRVYKGMAQTGAGDRIAARFGMNMGQLADHYDLDLNTDEGRRQLAEELLARYAERFDPAQLEGAPGVIGQAIDHIRNGMREQQGLNFSEGDALDMLKSAWRHTDPVLASRVAAAGAGVAQKRITDYGEISETPEEDAENVFTTRAAIARGARGNLKNEQARGTPIRDDQVLAAGSKLLRTEPNGADWVAPEILDSLKAEQLSRDNNLEHNVWVARGGQHVIKETKPDGGVGPYGIYPALPGLDVDRGHQWYGEPPEAIGHYAATAASPAQHLSSIELRNQLFPNHPIHFEGYTAHDGDPVARIVTTSPYVDPALYRESTEAERNANLAKIGFTPIDDRTYYNRDQSLLAYDLHGANLRVRDDDPRDFRVIDGTFAKLSGQLANHFDGLVDNNAYDRWKEWDNQRFQAEQGKQRYQELGYANESEYLREEAENQRYQKELDEQAAQAPNLYEQAAKERDNPPEQKPPEEVDLDNLMRLIARRTDDPIPQEVLDQLRSTLAEQKPTQGVRMGAAKGVANVDNPAVVRAAAAAPDQLLYDKVGAPVWNARANEVYSEHLGDLDRVMADFLSGKIANDRGVDTAVTVAAKLNRDFAEQRARTTDPTQLARIDQAQIAVNKRFYEMGTTAGQNLAAFNNAWYGAEGLLTKYHGALAQLQEGYISRDPNFKAAVRQLRGLLGDVNQDVSNRLRDLFLKADDAAKANSDKPVPVQYADWVAKSIVEQARRAGMPESEVPALQELFNRFRGTITQQAKEAGIEMSRPARERMTATQRIKEGLDNWDWMQRTLQTTVDQAQKAFEDKPEDDAATLAYKQRMRDAFTALGEQTRVPFTDSQLARFMSERQVSIGDLVRQHRSAVATTMDDLAEYLSRNSNLNPAQAQIVADAVASHVGAAIDVRRQAEFDRIIRDSAGKRYDPNGGQISMKRFIDLVNMGAFEDSAVADALAPSFGYKSYDPKFAAELRALGDKLEAYKRDGREGIQTEQIKLEMLDRLNDWRLQNLSPFQRFNEQRRNLFLGNILSGVPTHVVAMQNDLMEGLGSISGFMMRLPTMEARLAAVPRVAKYMMEGFVNGWDKLAHIVRTGVDPNRQISIKDIMENAGEGGYVPRRTDVAFTGLLAPYNYIFRAVTGLHALMRNGIQEPIEWLYSFDQLARDPNLSLEQAMNQADEAINGNAAFRQNAEQTAKAEGLTGRDYRLRVQEQIDANKPPITREVGQLFGSRTVFTQPPEGILGTVARGLQSMLREVPGLRYIVPFTNIVANVLNASINWTPVGFIRANPEMARRYFADVLRKAPDADIGEHEVNLLRQDLIAKASMGTAGIIGLWALSKIPGPNGQPLFQINGAGPPDAKKRYQLMDSGWMPHSIAFNLPGMAKPYYVPFEATPLSIGLSFIGAIEDSMRYGTGDGLQRAMSVLTQTGAAITDRSFLRGIQQTLDAFSGQENEAQGSIAVMRLMQGWAGSTVPYAGSAFVEQLYHQFVDPKLYQRGTGIPVAADLLRELPFANWIDGSKPQLNVLGEPITSYPYRRITGQLASQDPVWRFLDDHDVFLSDPNAPKIMGQTMTPEQRYNFTQARGAALKELLSDNLAGLSNPNLDPEVRHKMMDRFGELATQRGKAEVLSEGGQ